MLIRDEALRISDKMARSPNFRRDVILELAKSQSEEDAINAPTQTTKLPVNKEVLGTDLETYSGLFR